MPLCALKGCSDPANYEMEVDGWRVPSLCDWHHEEEQTLIDRARRGVPYSKVHLAEWRKKPRRKALRVPDAPAWAPLPRKPTPPLSLLEGTTTRPGTCAVAECDDHQVRAYSCTARIAFDFCASHVAQYRKIVDKLGERDNAYARIAFKEFWEALSNPRSTLTGAFLVSPPEPLPEEADPEPVVAAPPAPAPPVRRALDLIREMHAARSAPPAPVPEEGPADYPRPRRRG